jgi:hypothetical protein
MQDQEAKGKVMNIISKPKIAKSDVAELVDFTLEAKPVVKLREKMQLHIEEGLLLAKKLSKAKSRNSLKSLLSVVFEDL